ncbi:hypothetical protein [Segatella hominis]|uniref:hypothetical protein n=1 Tax=Segatella hominis TaxID=2518605 RepID=UPI003AB9223E
MRKTLLIAAALCLSASTMAQTFEQPLSVSPGDNHYNTAQAGDVYWVFKADQDYIATIKNYNGGELPQLAVLKDGETQPTNILGTTASNWEDKIYAFEKGKTYYFCINATGAGDLGFTIELEATQNVGKGLTENDPVEIKLGEKQVIGTPAAYEEEFNEIKAYATYKAEKDGQLQIKTEQRTDRVTVNGTTISAGQDNGKNVFKINTEKGQVYNIDFQLSIPVAIITSDVVVVKEGSFDMPYVLKEGENTIPAEAGKYYFSYKLTKKGYLHITSSEKVENAKLSVYGNQVHAKSEKNAVAESAEGILDVRTEIASTYGTYYVVVNKTAKTDKPSTFKMQMEDYKPGETAGTAIPVDVTETAKAITLPGAKGKYFYAITVPANTKKLLTVESPAALSEGTSVYVNTSEGTYGKTEMENQIIKRDVTSTREQKYYLVVTSNEAAPLTLNIKYADAEKGSLITAPKEAIIGSNIIDFDGTEYYTYKATQDGKLAVTVEDGVTVTFPTNTSGYGSYDTYLKDNTYSIQATKGTTYNIVFKNVKQGSTFTLEETQFAAGEVRKNPIVMTGDSYTLGENANNLWLKYEVTKTGVIEFSCDAPFSWSNFIGIAKNNGKAPVSMAEQIQDESTLDQAKPTRIDVYHAVFSVKEGDALYIQVSIEGDATGKKLTFTQRASKPGETIDNPIELKKGETLDVSKASLNNPIWVKARLTVGKNEFQNVDGGNFTPQQFCRLEDDGITYSGMPITWEGNSFIKEKTKEEDFIFMISYAEGKAKVKFVDDNTSGISNIELVPDSAPGIYTINGTKINSITGSGVYIIKSNGKTKKVVIKK